MNRRPTFPLLCAALALVFFAGPLVLSATGVRSHAFENRRLAAAPALSEGWGFFTAATRYLIDRLPLREQAVHANTWIDEHVFATAPVYGQYGLGGVASDASALPFSGRPEQDRAALAARAGAAAPAARSALPATAAQVVLGRQGWLYLQGVLDRACEPFLPFAAALREWERLLAVIRASGRRVILLVAPDKSTIYPGWLPPGTTHRDCGLQGTAELWQLLERPDAQRQGVVGLRRPLLAQERAQPGTRLYFKTDSHWNSVGALTFVRELVSAVSTSIRVRADEIVDAGEVRFGGDLLTLSGQSGTEVAPTRTVRRAPGAPRVAAPTLLLGDSFIDARAARVEPELAPYFAHLRILNWNDADAVHQARAIAAGRVVVLETAEREFDYRATADGFVAPPFVSLVARTLGVREPSGSSSR